MKNLPNTFALLVFVLVGLALLTYHRLGFNDLPFVESPWIILKQLEQSQLFDLSPNQMASGETQVYQVQVQRLPDLTLEQGTASRYVLKLRIKPSMKGVVSRYAEPMSFGLIGDPTKTSHRSVRVVAIKKGEGN